MLDSLMIYVAEAAVQKNADEDTPEEALAAAIVDAEDSPTLIDEHIMRPLFTFLFLCCLRQINYAT